MGSRRILLLAGLLLVACGVRRDGTVEGVATSLEVEVSPGRVELTLYLTNARTVPVVFTFPTAQRYDFGVIGESGQEVWRWSDGMSFTQVLTTDTLAPGETWRWTAEWSPGNRTGQYTAVAELTARETSLQQRVGFELP